MRKESSPERMPEPKPKITHDAAPADDDDSEYQIIPVAEIAPKRSNRSGARNQQKPASRGRKTGMPRENSQRNAGPRVSGRKPSPSLRE